MRLVDRLPSQASQSFTTPTETALLPRGISKGKIAAVVAGAGLLAAAYHWLHSPAEAGSPSWAARIDQERAAVRDRTVGRSNL